MTLSTMQKIVIKNRRNQNLSVLLEQSDQQKGLVFIMHGLGGFKEQKHLQAMAEAFLENNYTVVRFDTTNTLGESGGDYVDATTTNYFADLDDVITWAKTQLWYSEPFVLVGHSLGALCTALYAEIHSERVKALAPISTVVSGQLSAQIKTASGELDEWKRTGWRITKSESKPGAIKRLKWSHMEDRMKYDLLPNVSKLTMPVLLIVGEFDDTTPPEHQEILYTRLPGIKEMHVIKGAPHTFKAEGELQEINQIFLSWIQNTL